MKFDHLDPVLVSRLKNVFACPVYKPEVMTWTGLNSRALMKNKGSPVSHDPFGARQVYKEHAACMKVMKVMKVKKKIDKIPVSQVV